MPTWILIVLVAQLLSAIAALIDKFILVSKKVSRPLIYAFYVSVLSIIPILLFLLSPWRLKVGSYELPLWENISQPDITLIAMSLVSGFAGFYGLFSLYSALKESDASDVVPVVGSISAIGTFILSYFVLNDILSKNFLGGFVLMVLGTFLISHLRFNRRIIRLTINSGILFAIKATMIKAMFSSPTVAADASFDQAFFWSRIGILIVVICVLFIPRREEKQIKTNVKHTGVKGGLWVVGNAILGGVAAFITLKAIHLGNVTIIQSLGGIQFAILTTISFLVGRFIPIHYGENNTLVDYLQKGAAMTLITVGFFYLFL